MNAIQLQSPEGVVVHETAATALAAAIKADVSARYELALMRPRSWDNVRSLILRECKRPTFAASARYRKPIGKVKNEQTGEWEDGFVEGPSIRFAETACRYMTNTLCECAAIYDDERKQIIRVRATDLEANVSYFEDVTITKTVERRTLRQGQRPISQRVNSYGDVVYIVEATDDQVANKKGALTSKALRNQICRLIPGDLKDEAMELCQRVQKAEDAKDPDAARKRLFDSFAQLGVMPIHIQTFLGHDPGQLSPKELEELRAIYTAVREGETTWQEVADSRKPQKEGDSKEGKPKTADAVDEIVARHRKKQEDKKKAEEAKAAAAEKASTEAPKETAQREPGEDEE